MLAETPGAVAGWLISILRVSRCQLCRKALNTNQASDIYHATSVSCTTRHRFDSDGRLAGTQDHQKRSDRAHPPFAKLSTAWTRCTLWPTVTRPAMRNGPKADFSGWLNEVKVRAD
ncbi:hypothetical protein N7539_000153 [Penicillium diatomitis]|uniref:Uncharacterized protein n=1 Tax=Penicillium diatomitis TaxID=2819901 RepID=A0A9X0C1Y2_9EURO|nr:uncharacterized protein N7539_000153 [Penicillium diatomitis]KAJ5495037.1 hypothetical protein N7539_000153 [Penicillium diatomitis]